MTEILVQSDDIVDTNCRSRYIDPMLICIRVGPCAAVPARLAELPLMYTRAPWQLDGLFIVVKI